MFVCVWMLSGRLCNIPTFYHGQMGVVLVYVLKVILSRDLDVNCQIEFLTVYIMYLQMYIEGLLL